MKMGKNSTGSNAEENRRCAKRANWFFISLLDGSPLSSPCFDYQEIPDGDRTYCSGNFLLNFGKRKIARTLNNSMGLNQLEENQIKIRQGRTLFTTAQPRCSVFAPLPCYKMEVAK
jgi:hypothetical protein